MKQAGAPFHVVELDRKSDDPSGSDIQSALAQKTGACLRQQLHVEAAELLACNVAIHHSLALSLAPCMLMYPVGRRTVPNVFLAKETIGGGSDVEALFQSGQLTEMLEAAGVLK